MNSFTLTTSKYRTAIMGLSMLSIMLFHQYFTSTIPFNFFHNFGYWGVDVFLFLSGMGLVNSLNYNSLKTYYSRRFNRIIPSCFLCGSVKYILFILLGNTVAILKEGLNIGIWSIMSLDLWFIPTIIILYAISPFLYMSLKKRTYLTFLFVIFVFFLNGFFIKPKIGYEWLSPLGILSWTTERLPVFLLGMFWGIRKDWRDEKKQYYSYLFLIMAIGLILLEKIDISFQGMQACQYFTLMLGMPSLITLSTSFLKKLPNRLIQTFNFFGTYSLELYLVHEFVFWILIILFNDVNPFLLLSVGFIFSCISAYICKTLVQKVTIIKNLRI